MIDQAIAFAAMAHAGQRRKYRAVPYIVHPLHVMEIVATVTDDEDMWTAAVLHDVIEDTPVTDREIERRFGPEITRMVVGLTKVKVPGNRAVNKASERIRLGAESPEVHTIKCADLIANAGSIRKNDTKFWSVWSDEAAQLLRVITTGDVTLWERARAELEIN